MKDRHKYIEQLITKHIQYRASFEKIDAGFISMYVREGKRYTNMGKDMAISLHMTKTVDKIIKGEPGEMPMMFRKSL
jgi:hypothetical protein